jgi:hypothetical protein
VAISSTKVSRTAEQLDSDLAAWRRTAQRMLAAPPQSFPNA